MLTEIIVTALVTALVTHFGPKGYAALRQWQKGEPPLGNFIVAVDRAPDGLIAKEFKIKVTPAVSKKSRADTLKDVEGDFFWESDLSDLSQRDEERPSKVFHFEMDGDKIREIRVKASEEARAAAKAMDDELADL